MVGGASTPAGETRLWRPEGSGAEEFGELKGKGLTLSCNETGEYFESKDDVGVTTNDDVQEILEVSKDDVEVISSDEEVQEIVEISHKPDSACCSWTEATKCSVFEIVKPFLSEKKL